MFVSILLLSLLGASSAFFYYPPMDNSQAIVEKFLTEMIKTIETKDSVKISDLFTDNFLFHGCNEDYDKNKTVAMLTMIPSETDFIVAYKSSKFISGDKIEYFVSIAGFNPAPVEARFILSAGKLKGGSVPTCQKFHEFIGSPFGTSDNARIIVKMFLDKMASSIQSGDYSIISDLFKPDFVYETCTETVGKTKMVALLFLESYFQTKVSLTLKSVEDLGSSIKFLVPAIGFGEAEVSEYVLNKSDLQLESGRHANCPEMFGRIVDFTDVFA